MKLWFEKGASGNWRLTTITRDGCGLTVPEGPTAAAINTMVSLIVKDHSLQD